MKKSMARKSRKSFMGRALRRFMREELGIELLEFAVLGLLVVALCAIGVANFGHTLVDMFGSLGYTATGYITEADTLQDNAASANGEGLEKAQAYASGKHNSNTTKDQDLHKDTKVK